MCCTFHVSAGFNACAEPSADSVTTSVLHMESEREKQFSLFLEVCKLQQLFWLRLYFNNGVWQVKCTSTPRLLEGLLGTQPPPTSVPVHSESQSPLSIVKSPRCIFSSAVWNHTNLCQTFRDLNSRRKFFMYCFLTSVVWIIHLWHSVTCKTPSLMPQIEQCTLSLALQTNDRTEAGDRAEEDRIVAPGSTVSAWLIPASSSSSGPHATVNPSCTEMKASGSSSLCEPGWIGSWRVHIVWAWRSRWLKQPLQEISVLPLGVGDMI